MFRETKNRYKWEDSLILMKTDTKTTLKHQRDITSHGKITHQTKRETDVSGDRESIRPKGQPTKSDTKTTSENQRDVANHGKTTHETKHENDISRTKEPIQMRGQLMKTDTKTTSENYTRITNHGKTTHKTKPENDFLRTNGTFLIIRRQLTKPTTSTISRETKNRYE